MFTISRENPGGPSTSNTLTSPGAYTNPVMAFDFPDPSVARFGDTFWAVATTTEWEPYFRLMHSKDLVHWQPSGFVFNEQPAWADANFWAPEIFNHNGKSYIYYTAHARGGALAVAVAVADRPEGPYKDMGILITQPLGSIDAHPIKDHEGRLWLIWKEDGNSRGEPTPLWIQRLSDDGLHLEGPMHEIFRNDSDWEDNLVEGISIIYRDGWYYGFYAGNACCGKCCKYATGVARAKSLLGPWEKHPNNPILKSSEEWKCPGHGSVVETDDGRTWYLYHAYCRSGSVYVGRQALLDEIFWDKATGWPYFNNNQPSGSGAHTSYVQGDDQLGLTEDFSSGALRGSYSWPMTARPTYNLEGGKLNLAHRATRYSLGTLMVTQTNTGDYVLHTQLDMPGQENEAGLLVIGDINHAIGISAGGGYVNVWRLQAGERVNITHCRVPYDKVQLSITASEGHLFSFAWAAAGEQMQGFEELVLPYDASYLPPWDTGLKAGLQCLGDKAFTASFHSFSMRRVLQLSRHEEATGTPVPQPDPVENEAELVPVPAQAGGKGVAQPDDPCSQPIDSPSLLK